MIDFTYLLRIGTYVYFRRRFLVCDVGVVLLDIVCGLLINYGRVSRHLQKSCDRVTVSWQIHGGNRGRETRYCIITVINLIY